MDIERNESDFKNRTGHWSDVFFESINVNELLKSPNVLSLKKDDEIEYSSRSGACPSRIITQNGIRYFVKYPGYSGFNETEFVEIFIELFISFLAKKLGIECTDTKMFVDYDIQTVGIACADFGEHFTFSQIEDRVYHPFYPAQSIIDRIKERIENCEIDSSMLEKLNFISCFDYLVKQRDRNSKNFGFRITEKDGKKVVSLLPMFDNAQAFIHRTDNNYQIAPNDCDVNGVGQQKLLNGEYKYILEFFEKNFSKENFPKLLKEFYAQYGADKLFVRDERGLQKLTEQIQAQVQEQISFCKMRETKQTFIPLEAVLVTFNKHRHEVEKQLQENYEFPYSQNNLFYLFWSKLARYYEMDGDNNGYFGFYEGKVGEILKWKWFDEALKLAENPTKEMEDASKIVEAKKRKYYSYILSGFMKDIFIDTPTKNKGFLQYVLIDDETAFNQRSQITNSYAQKDERIRYICYNYPEYKYLRDWCEKVKAGEIELTAEQQKEFKAIKKLLNKYIKFVNSYTNRRLSERDVELLRKNGVNISKNDLL